MKTAVRPQTVLLVVLIFVIGLALGLVLARPLFRKEEPEDPHAGQVWIYDGYDWTWMTPLEGVPINDITQEQIRFVSGRPTYRGSDYETVLGVDVSEHQHEIDWEKVAASGVDFAYIRVGRRGYTQGGLFDDPFFESNLLNARAAGLRVGVYFYSQAITPEEAAEEADFVLDRIHGRVMDLPVIFDWEKVDNEDADIARTKDLDMQTRTACALAFCDRIQAGGYDAGLYYNRTLGYYGYDLTQLTDYLVWFALPEHAWPSFYYKIDIWQYSFTEEVPGIEGETDMNILFTKIQTETPAPTA
ncbi:MAG: glycoside hydrolase family 25 protein [Oscillospiraceae bacterium]|nr:glycoside hydrolase family 25 protein [Oscillospiraceae bacterium]